MAFNKVILVGNLVENPELKVTSQGTSVVNFRIAVGRKHKKEGQPEADFFSIVAWSGTAEFISKYFTKGRSILICGELQSRTWEDQNGQKRYIVEVVASEATFVDKKPEGQQSVPAVSQPQVSGPVPNFEEISTEDDLPF